MLQSFLVKKSSKPETFQTFKEPLPQEVIDWYISTLGATPAEKVDQMLEYLEKSAEVVLDEKTPHQTTTKNIR